MLKYTVYPKFKKIYIKSKARSSSFKTDSNKNHPI